MDVLPKSNEAGAASLADRGYHHGNLRAAAINAALEALSHRMPSEISLRELAKAIGVRHSALYVHFRDRDELFAIVSGQGFQSLKAELEQASEHASENKVSALAVAYLRFARANPAHYRVMYSSTNVTADNKDHVDQFCNACFRLLVDAVAETQDGSGDDTERRALGIWCALHGLVQLGGETGVLRQRVSADDEDALAIDFACVLAQSVLNEPAKVKR